MALSKNIGNMDRLIRGVVGLMLVMDGLKHKSSLGRQLETLAGGALIANALTGHCSMLSALKASTVPGKDNNILEQVKAKLPNQEKSHKLTEDETSEAPPDSMQYSLSVGY